MSQPLFYESTANAVDFITWMQAHIDNLVKLQAVELERAGLAQAARALPAEIAHAEAALAAAQRMAAEASTALSHEESLRSRLEREITTHRQKEARYRTQQNTLIKDDQAKAMDHELSFAETEAERLENEAFASLERSEAQEAVLAAARVQVESLAAALDQTRERVRLRQSEIKSRQAALAAQRETLRSLIETDLLARFDRLCATRGTGIARAENQQCTGCRMGVRPQTWNQLRAGELLTCDSCARFLYWDPAMVPAADSTRQNTKPKRKSSKAAMEE